MATGQPFDRLRVVSKVEPRELTLLVVSRDGARLAGLRLEYSGETSCAASAEELSALLDRRGADAVIFLSHADLAAPVLDYLRRRGKPPPASVIALGNGLGDSNPQLAATLRRLADAGDPRDLLAGLFEALGSAKFPCSAEPLPEPSQPAPAQQSEPESLREGVALPNGKAEPQPDEPPPPFGDPEGPPPFGPEGPQGPEGQDGPEGPQPEARARRLEVVLERRLARSLET